MTSTNRNVSWPLRFSSTWRWLVSVWRQLGLTPVSLSTMARISSKLPALFTMLQLRSNSRNRPQFTNRLTEMGMTCAVREALILSHRPVFMAVTQMCSPFSTDIDWKTKFLCGVSYRTQTPKITLQFSQQMPTVTLACMNTRSHGQWTTSMGWIQSQIRRNSTCQSKLTRVLWPICNLQLTCLKRMLSALRSDTFNSISQCRPAPTLLSTHTN